MKRLGMLLVVTGLVAATFVPLSSGMAQSLALEVKQVWYVNKSPFILEGKTEPGSIVEVLGQGINIKVDDNGFFNIELKIEEGINLFAITASKDGLSSTKSVMIEMDSTPPFVILLVEGRFTKEKMIKLELQDASKFEISGFTEPGCKILADSNECAIDNIAFKAALETGKAPSVLDHFLDVNDKYGNLTRIIVFSNNIHRHVAKVKIGSDIINTDGKEMKMKTPLQIIGSSAMISLDIIPDGILTDSTMIAVDDSVTIVVRASTLRLIFGKNYCYLDGKKIDFSGTPPSIVGGHLLVPLRLICDIYKIDLQYEKKTHSFTLIRKLYEN